MVGLSDVSFERVPAESSGRSIRFADKFERGQLNAWQMPYRKDWEILAENGNHHLHMKRNREPLVPRRPVQFVLVKGVNAGSFDLRLRGRRQGRSMIVVFNYVGTLHFYYTHLSEDRGRKQRVSRDEGAIHNEGRTRDRVWDIAVLRRRDET